MTYYHGDSNFNHRRSPCLGVLVTNLGTPDAPTVTAVRRYLAEFLWDRRVIELPRLPWWLILHAVILNTRPRRSAHAYSKVWTNEGSPLLVISKRQAAGLQNLLSAHCQGPVQVELAMRYGSPSIASGLAKLRAAGAERIIVLPLYPQYSAPATASTFDAVAAELKTWRWLPELRFVCSYHDDEGYIDAMVKSIRTAWQQRSQPQRLLFSFHGLPKDYFQAGDPYFCQCQKTARLIAERLGLDRDRYLVTFQSRLGPREWLQPYTDVTLRTLAQSGIHEVDIVCPGFAADCLETLEEIQMQNKDLFIAAGGRSFNYIPALNDNPDHLSALTTLVLKHCQGWPETSLSWSSEAAANALAQRAQLATSMGGG